MSARLYIDTEFNGFGGQLMSMALVSDDGREWYQVLPLPANIEGWVAVNVVPILGKAPMKHDEFRLSLRVFLSQFDNPTICADWYTDIAWFFTLFAGRDHTESWAYPCQAALLGNVPDLKPEIPHNALSDARALRDWHVSIQHSGEGSRTP
jgi:hypothetical protein